MPTDYKRGAKPWGMSLVMVWSFVLFATGTALGQEPGIISQLSWKLQSTSSHNGAFEKIGDYAFDGQPGTLWESASQVPATLDIDLGHLYEVHGFTYLPRQEGPWGTLKDYEFYTSTDGVQWGQAVAQGTFVYPTAYMQKEQGDHFSFVEARYVKLKILSGYNTKNQVLRIAEIHVLKKDSSD